MKIRSRFVSNSSSSSFIIDATTEKDIIGMPKIGCGLAGGNWDVVKTLIEKYLSDRTVYVFYF